jgi:hypothetical protein
MTSLSPKFDSTETSRPPSAPVTEVPRQPHPITATLPAFWATLDAAIAELMGEGVRSRPLPEMSQIYQWLCLRWFSQMTNENRPR